jgi:hypothetical protein
MRAVYTFIELPVFTRSAADCLDYADLAALQRTLAANAEAGDLAPDTRGVRKLRWTRPGMGKRGRLRVPY